MDIDKAIEIVDACCFKPGYEIWGLDYTDRFEGAVKVHCELHLPNYNEENAPQFEVIGTGVYDNVIVGVDRMTEDEFTYWLFACLLDSEQHEAREAFRIHKGDRWVAPFHPHKVDGMRAWGNWANDVKFGVA